MSLGTNALGTLSGTLTYRMSFDWPSRVNRACNLVACDRLGLSALPNGDLEREHLDDVAVTVV